MSAKTIRVRPASRSFNRLLRLTLGRALVELYNVVAVNLHVLRQVKPPYIVLPNHFTTWDPFILGYFMPGPVYNVTSDVQFRSGIMRLLLGLVGAIPKSKVISDYVTVKNIFAIKNRKGIIGIYPEGKRSWDGHTSRILYSTAKLIKLLKIPVVVPIMRGGYLSLPRWTQQRRRGKIVIEFRRLFTGSDVRELSVDQIHAKIQESLQHDEYEYQKNQMVPYRGKNLAEHLELALFVCPQCSTIGRLISKGSVFSCGSCGYAVRYNRYGFFESRNGKLYFDSVRAWNVWQLDWLTRHMEQLYLSRSEELLLREDNLLLLVGFRTRPLRRFRFGDMSLYLDRIVFRTLLRGTLVFPLREIEGVNVQIRERLEFYHKNTLYRFHAGRRLMSGFMWMSAIEILQRLETGSSSSEV